MRKFILAASFIVIAGGTWAQEVTTTTTTTKTTKKTVKGKWTKGGMIILAGSQGGSRNWAPGGDRFTLGANGFLTLFANHTKKRGHWDNRLEANYGLLNSRTYGIVKNDDKIDFISRWSHELGKATTGRKFRYGVMANFRSQFVDGYDFDGEIKKRISSFLAPGIVVLSAGGEFVSAKGDVDIHVGPAGRWVIVANRPFELAANYGVLPNREVKIEAGAFASVTYNKEIMKNITYRSRLDLFSDIVEKDPGNMDVFWTNMLMLKVNNYIGLVYNLDVQYDDNTRIFGYTKTRPATQLKSILGVGLTVKL